MDNGGRRHHTAAMGPHPRQKSTQQSTNIICDGSTSLKLEKKFLLLVILLIMHVGSTPTSDDDDAATRRWATCSPLDDIADSDGTLPLPTIYSAERTCWKVSARPSARLPLKSNLSVVPTGRPKALGRPRSLQWNKTT